MIRHCLPFALPILALQLPLLAQDPPVPPAGFKVRKVLDKDIAWSDTYKTRIDLYVPDHKAPNTGWPGVKVMHGSGGSRKLPDVRTVCEFLARNGYVAYAYDGREAGETRRLNPTWTTPRTQERVLLDSAESHGQAQRQLPGLVDPKRIGVTGFSGGGVRNVHAAAWSGKRLPLTGAVTHYPVVSAAVPEIANVDTPQGAAFQGTLATDYRVQGLPPTDPVVVALKAGDLKKYAQLVTTPYDVKTLQELATSKVPMLAMFAMQDFKIWNNPSVDRFLSLPKGTPRHLFLSTGGHSTPKNSHERRVMLDLRERWFDRFLKNEKNGADLERPVSVAMQPPTDHMQTVLASIWETRFENQWPPANTPKRFYLRDSRQLTAAAPTTYENGPTISHTVASGYTIETYIAEGGGKQAKKVTAKMPKVVAAFQGAPLSEQSEIVGRPRVKVLAVDTTGLFQLTAVLKHVSPVGIPTWITAGTAGIRPGRRGVHSLTIELGDVGHVVPKGHRLRLELMNLGDIQAPGHRRIRMVPYFESTSTRVLMEPGAASYLEVPLRPYRPNLSPRLAFAFASQGIDHRLELRGGAARARKPYAAYLGMSGSAPGLNISGLPHVPLNVDMITMIGISLINTPVLPNFAGTLDGAGRAAPRFVIPAGPVANDLAGLRFTFIASTMNGTAIESVTGATTLIIRP